MTPVEPPGSRGAAAEPARLDVERFRWSTRRTLVVRRPAFPTVVLGNTQDPAVVNGEQAQLRGTSLVHRRSGGGAVLVVPQESVWVDVWVPAADPLADDDVVRAAGWVGDWWSRALAGLSVEGAAVHRARASCWPLSDLICFAGLAAGEVEVGGRKVVGVSQWRCRQGALFQCLANLHWDPAPLLDLLVVPPEVRASGVEELVGAAAGIAELCWARDVRVVEEALLAELPGAGVRGRPGGTWAISFEPIG